MSRVSYIILPAHPDYDELMSRTRCVWEREDRQLARDEYDEAVRVAQRDQDGMD